MSAWTEGTHDRIGGSVLVQSDIEQELAQMSRDLLAETEQSRTLGLQVVTARRKADVLIQKAMLRIKAEHAANGHGRESIDLVRGEAELEAGDELWEALRLEELQRASERAQRNLRAAIDAHRSLLASVRAQT